MLSISVTVSSLFSSYWSAVYLSLVGDFIVIENLGKPIYLEGGCFFFWLICTLHCLILLFQAFGCCLNIYYRDLGIGKLYLMIIVAIILI